MPAVRDTYVNPLLTQVSVGYSNQAFVAEQIFPTVTVEKETGLYFVGDKEAWRTPADANRGEYSRANRVNNNLAQAAYTLTERSLEAPISDRIMRQYSNPFDPKKNATELVSQKLLLENELDLRNTLTSLGGSYVTDQATAWGTAGTDVVGTVRTGRNTILKATGQDANTFLLGKGAADAILKNTAILDAIKYTARTDEGTVLKALADFFGVERVLIGKAVQNTAKEGQTDATGFVWDKVAVLCYVPSGAALEAPAAGYRLTLSGGRYVDEWYEKEIKTTIVRANDFYDNKVVVPEAIQVFTNVA